MTIIATDGRTMVSDTYCFSEHFLSSTFPKIVRAPDGSLVGASGLVADCHALREWVIAGMDFKNPPTLAEPFNPDRERDTSVDWMWLKVDGTVWRGLATMATYPQKPPTSIGMHTATVVVETAMALGVPIVRAVEFAIDRCNGIGGEVQIEHLRPR